MIRSLKLKNWKSHANSEFEFGPGTNVLVGIMGSGKTSVLSAISFALFGTFPALRSREVTLDEVIQERPRRKEEALIELAFELSDGKFGVKREIERGKGTTQAEIRKDGELLDTGASRTTELVEKYLKVDYELFSRAVYSEQDELDYFLEIPKGQRMKRMDSLLRIDRFEKCRSNTITLINRLADQIESKSKIVDEMEEKEDFGKIQELEDEIGELKGKIKKQEKKLKKRDKLYQQTKEDLRDIREGLEAVKELEKKRNSLKGAISSVKKDIESLAGELELSEEELEEKFEKLTNEVEELEEKKEEMEDRLEELRDREGEIKARIQDLQRRIQKLKGAKGKCPICGSELTDKHKRELEEERREKISELAKKREQIQDQKEKEEKKQSEMRSKTEELEKKKRDLDKKLDKMETLESKREEVGEKEEEEEGVAEKLKEKEEKYDQEKVNQKQDKLEELSGEKSEIEAEIKSGKKFLKEKEERVEELKDREETFQRYKQEIEKSKDLNEDLKKFRNVLKTTQEQLRKQFIQAVNRTLGKVWNRLYPYEDFTDIRLTVKEGDYELQFRSGGNWQSVEGIASGGERTSACLALRIAFALVLAPNLRWLVLDEPTHNLDRRAVEDLAELLRTKVSELVDQVFLITHNEALESASNSYLYKLEREKERNEPTQVKEIT